MRIKMIQNCNGVIFLNKDKSGKLTADLLLKKLINELNNMGQEATINGFKIDFNRKLQFTTHSGQNKMELFKILRKGKIQLEEHKNKFSIKFCINLSNFLFSIALLFLLSFIINRLFTDNNIILSLFYALIISVGTYIFGYIYIKDKISNIISNIT